jgi:hypothetical protein
MTASNLRDRIAAVLGESLHRQQGIDRPDRFKDWIDNRELADAVIAALDLAKPCVTAGCRMRRLTREGFKYGERYGI